MRLQEENTAFTSVKNFQPFELRFRLSRYMFEGLKDSLEVSDTYFLQFQD